MSTTRERADRCPGVLRPWPADDGALVRLRLPGGRLPTAALLALVDLAERYGDGLVHLTTRANLQVRALPSTDGVLPEAVIESIEAAGLLPSRRHDLVRNVMVSPQTGLAGGRADLRPVVAELDRSICADSRLATLPGRFLFVLDDGRGDLLDRDLDLGLLALSGDRGQVRIGSQGWGEVVSLTEAPAALVALAHRFLDLRGNGPEAPWHVDELDRPLAPPRAAPPALPSTPPLPTGEVPGGRHVVPADHTIDRALAEQVARVAGGADEIVVTPWRGVLVPTPTGWSR